MRCNSVFEWKSNLLLQLDSEIVLGDNQKIISSWYMASLIYSHKEEEKKYHIKGISKEEKIIECHMI